jgi:hypothetical protein
VNRICRKAFKSGLACAAALWLLAAPAAAGPWAEAGDPILRSDINILAAAGVIDDITMQWPLPWDGILARLDASAALDGQPDYVRDAAARVRARGSWETRSDRVRAAVSVDVASSPAVVRGFDALGRQTVQGQASLDYLSGSTSVHLALGAQTTDSKDHQVFVPDGSYIAQRIGGVRLYAGYVDHWWGPGWISAMSLSNNARPVPQIGIARAGTAPFESPWLSWIGPWQMEFFVGVMDGPRIARNTIYDGFRFAFSPLPHLEIGLSRTDMMCGTGHPCKPISAYFDPRNDFGHSDEVNDQASIDVHYSRAYAGLAYELYAQAMNEDTNPIVHSGTSHLFGASLWAPVAGGTGRLTVEYADSLATRDIWGSGIFHGFAYNNWQYADGMRYRGRTLGFSLDSDSRLLSVQASFTTPRARSFTLTYHRAEISDPLNTLGNVVTTSPVTINMVQARVSLPFKMRSRTYRFEIEGRLQDDRPRPDKGHLAMIEAALTIDL